jgi:cbb3-type cytochrome oxidase subunit 3
MIRDILRFAGETSWVQIGLVICLLAFLAIVVFTYMGRKNRYEHERHLPLEDGTDDNKPSRHDGSSQTSAPRTNQ